MQKKHVSPEFTVIKQDEANAKFFVASFDNGGVAAGQSAKTTSSVASTYTEGGDNGDNGLDSLW